MTPLRITAPGPFRLRNGRVEILTRRAANDSYRWQNALGETWDEHGRAIDAATPSDFDIVECALCDGSGVVTATDDLSSWPCGCLSLRMEPSHSFRQVTTARRPSRLLQAVAVLVGAAFVYLFTIGSFS